jgi:L-alanine-DL-glutamate epimerase-like enolase superfamily enzyme
MITIAGYKSRTEREPLASPFGFKGAYLSELWQSIVQLQSSTGQFGTGLGVQSALWSDPRLFAERGEQEGNRLMREVTRQALASAKGLSFETPVDLLDRLLPGLYEYARELTGYPGLRLTFVLNALVPLDHAAWILYSRENGRRDFAGMLPETWRSALGRRQGRLALTPLVAYGTSDDAVRRLLDEGHFVLKIKLGSDPDGDGDPDKMLQWDKERISAVHRICADRECPYTENGRIAYYLDANSRYDSKERVRSLLEHARDIGALERIIVFEEPFVEDSREDVSDLPVPIAADESIQNEEDVLNRLQLGYRALALKPVAKTLSMSLKMAKLARQRGVPCYCADLTANPLMVDWNKNMAAHLDPLPGLKVGLLESNGPQNYLHWDRMKTYHPENGASWIDARNGLFILDRDFYEASGGVFGHSAYDESFE